MAYQSEIEEIINGSHSIREKEALINRLSKELLEEIRSGYKLCPRCNTYYRETTWDTVTESKTERVCIYEDPINSGGNEYKDKLVKRTYEVCPVGHKIEI